MCTSIFQGPAQIAAMKKVEILILFANSLFSKLSLCHSLCNALRSTPFEVHAIHILDSDPLFIIETFVNSFKNPK